MGDLIQFPLKQTTMTQQVRNGEIWYVYLVEFQSAGMADSVLVFARDDAEALQKVYDLTLTAKLCGPLSRYVADQNNPNTPQPAS